MMRPSDGIRIAKPFGIDLRLDPSWFVLSFLIAWSMATMFREVPELRGLSSGAYLALGVMAAILFFVSVVAHELAHSLMAQRKGIEVKAITLFIFGGVAQITSDPKTPGDEFKIAVVGPLLSVVLGGFLFGIGVLAELQNILAAAALFQLIGFLNGYLAVFNLLPGLPLDGGRILRAAIWRWRGDFIKATHVSSITGRLMAAVLVGAGIFRIFVWHDFGGGVWWIILGIFLNQSAVGSYRQSVLVHSMSGKVAGNLMTASVRSIPGNIRLDQAIEEYFVAHHHSAFPVLGYGDGLEGIVTLEAVQQVPQPDWPSVTVRQVMIPLQESIIAKPEEPITQLLLRLASNPAGRFLVTRDHSLLGILTLADIRRG
ncbi:MAG: site-2 protease family protein [Actinomycetota bacterium]